MMMVVVVIIMIVSKWWWLLGRVIVGEDGKRCIRWVLGRDTTSKKSSL